MTDEREREALYDAVDHLLDRFEDEDAVAYAEVGTVEMERTDVVVTEDGPRDTTEFSETGVSCRVFADGAADYRYTTHYDEEALDDVADRAIRGGEFLAQDEPARFDRYTLHRASHDGWADEPIHAPGLDEKLAALEATDPTDEAAVERGWLTYRDAHVESSLTTTVGSTVRTVRDRASVEVVLETAAGPTVERHAGTTRGGAFLDRLPEVLGDAAADARALAAAEPVAAPTGETDLVLAPRAAGQLIAFVARYLEADHAYLGLSPYAVGDRIGPETLSIEDGVRAGSWAARAFDAEARPTTPVGLVEDGRVATMLHNVASAADTGDGAAPAGNAVPSLGFEGAPRIHARHLDVAPGTTTRAALRADADLVVERFGDAWLRDEFERAQRTGHTPASVMYAKDVERKIQPREERGTADLPVAEGYRLVDGERAGRVTDATLRFEPSLLAGIDALGDARETLTGVDEKHKSRLPVAVTAPGIRLRGRLV
jgi:TldD protein